LSTVSSKTFPVCVDLQVCRLHPPNIIFGVYDPLEILAPNRSTPCLSYGHWLLLPRLAPYSNWIVPFWFPPQIGIPLFSSLRLADSVSKLPSLSPVSTYLPTHRSPMFLSNSQRTLFVPCNITLLVFPFRFGVPHCPEPLVSPIYPTNSPPRAPFQTTEYVRRFPSDPPNEITCFFFCYPYTCAPDRFGLYLIFFFRFTVAVNPSPVSILSYYLIS